MKWIKVSLKIKIRCFIDFKCDFFYSQGGLIYSIPLENPKIESYIRPSHQRTIHMSGIVLLILTEFFFLVTYDWLIYVNLHWKTIVEFTIKRIRHYLLGYPSWAHCLFLMFWTLQSVLLTVFRFLPWQLGSSETNVWFISE